MLIAFKTGARATGSHHNTQTRCAAQRNVVAAGPGGEAGASHDGAGETGWLLELDYVLSTSRSEVTRHLSCAG